MPKLHRLKTSIALLLAGLTSSAIASSTGSSPYFQHEARLAVVNEAPYLISYESSYAPRNERGNRINNFRIWFPGSPDIPHNETLFAGTISALKYGMEQVEGRFSFMIKDAQGGKTDEKFDLNFVVKKNDDAGTFARLHTRTLNPETGNEEIEPYHLLSVQMSKSCNRADTTDNLRPFNDTCIFTFHMSPTASACHEDPDCNGREYSRHNQD